MNDTDRYNYPDYGRIYNEAYKKNAGTFLCPNCKALKPNMETMRVHRELAHGIPSGLNS